MDEHRTSRRRHRRWTPPWLLPGAARLREAGGQALVEFALVIPLILLLVLGVLDFGQALNDDNSMTQVAEEAARYAAIGSCGTSCTSISSLVISGVDNATLANGSSSGTGPDQPLVVCFDFPNGTSNEGDPVQAVVETNYRWLPYLHLSTERLYATATMRLETAYASGDPYTASTLTAAGNCPSYT